MVIDMTIKNCPARFVAKEDNPFNDPGTLKEYGEFDGDLTGFVDTGVKDNEL